MIPLALVAGFLGSGKTTLLREVARAAAPRRLLFLVNEFAPADVDGAVLLADGADVLALPGGSIFCRCLVTQFIGQLRQIAARWAEASPRFEGVAIEASGMADPRVIGRMLAETGLDRQFALASIVAVADPLRLPKLLHTLPSARAQIEAADTVVLNKTDLATPEQVTAAEKLISDVRPGLAVLRASRGRPAPDLFPAHPAPHAPAGDYAPCRDPAFATEVLPAPGEIDPARLEAALRAAGDAVYRLKGFASCDGRAVRIEYAGDRVAVEPAPPGAGHRRELVLIYRPDMAAEARQRLMDALTGGRTP